MFKTTAIIIYVIAGLLGTLISLGIIFEKLGFIAGLITIFLAPVALAFVPWYEALANGNWFLVILVYGGGIFGTILMTMGSAIDNE